MPTGGRQKGTTQINGNSSKRLGSGQSRTLPPRYSLHVSPLERKMGDSLSITIDFLTHWSIFFNSSQNLTWQCYILQILELIQYQFQCSINWKATHNFLYTGFAIPSTKEEKHGPFILFWGDKNSLSSSSSVLQVIAVITPFQLRVNCLQNSPELGKLESCTARKGKEKEKEGKGKGRKRFCFKRVSKMNTL